MVAQQPTNNPPEPHRYDRDFIHRLVCRFTPACLDRDGLVSEIILECLIKHQPASFTIIHRRCIDLVRRSQKEIQVNRAGMEARRAVEKERTKEEIGFSSSDRHNLVTELIADAGLTPEERQVLFLHIYEDQSFVEIARTYSKSLYDVTFTYQAAVRKVKELCDKRNIKKR